MLLSNQLCRRGGKQLHFMSSLTSLHPKSIQIAVKHPPRFTRRTQLSMNRAHAIGRSLSRPLRSRRMLAGSLGHIYYTRSSTVCVPSQWNEHHPALCIDSSWDGSVFWSTRFVIWIVKLGVGRKCADAASMPCSNAVRSEGISSFKMSVCKDVECTSTPCQVQSSHHGSRCEIGARDPSRC